ncbi:MAG: S9 family peptidase [Myxococcota bacterium]
MTRVVMAVLCAMLLGSCSKASAPPPEHARPEPTMTTEMRPPTAQKVPQSTTLHGDTRVDDYGWLRQKEAPEVTEYLEAENAYAAAVLEGTIELQATLYDEIVGRIQETDRSAPYPMGRFEYYRRTFEGKQYPVYCRRAPGDDSTEEVLLDMNALAKDRPFLGLGGFEVSPNGRYLAYSLDETGFRDYTLRVKDLDTGEDLRVRIEKVKTFAWANDNRTFLYTTDDDTKRAYRVYRHALFDAGDDPLLFQEDDERFRVAVWRSRSGKMLFRGSFSHTTSEVAFAGADGPGDAWTLVAPREQGHEYDVSHRGSHFLIRTNDTGRNFRVVEAPVASPGRGSWKEVVPQRDGVMIESLDVFRDFFVLLEREQGLPYLRTELFSGESHRVSMDEPVYSIRGGHNAEFDRGVYRFRYESLTTPDSTYDYDPRTRSRKLIKRQEVLGGYEPSDYVSERTWATASDGTKVPVSVVRKRDTAPNGSSPMLLAGYGSYGYPYPTMFSPARVSLLDRGFVYAIAHVRGGGELGKHWHDDGKMAAKENTFTDFIAAAEHLVANRYTSSDRLAIMGGSAGGLLMGAVANLRPDLFAVVVSLVPFVDVLNTMLDDSLPLTVGEYEEWGNPNEFDAYFRIKGYCPYSNIAKQEYPAMLVRTSLNDSQVMYWEPAKYVAKLRAHKTDDNLLVFQINMEAGHGGASGRYDHIRETSLDYAFVLTEIGAQERSHD